MQPRGSDKDSRSAEARHRTAFSLAVGEVVISESRSVAAMETRFPAGAPLILAPRDLATARTTRRSRLRGLAPHHDAGAPPAAAER